MNVAAFLSAKYLIYIIVIVSLDLLYRHFLKNKKEAALKALVLFLGVLLAVFVSKILQQIFPSQPPFVVGDFTPLIPHSSDPSFPSDHAAVAAALATFNYYQDKKWGIGSFLFAFIVAWGRVFVGVHYFKDVIAGLVLGMVVMYLTNLLVNYLWRFRFPAKSKV